MRFSVVIPAFNRENTIGEALESLIRQTHGDWDCLVLDDGSSDRTYEVARGYAEKDARISVTRFTTNAGGVAMNEIGMTVAAEGSADVWTRLGSDDTFEPHKLATDEIALRYTDVCYGPYRVRHASYLDKTLYSPPMDAKGVLLSGGFAGSWASIAVRTSVLRAVKQRFGSFCDSRIKNMEDWLVNTRIACVTQTIAWRGLKKAGGVIVGGYSWEDVGGEDLFVHDAGWRVASDGASNKQQVIEYDAKVTREVIEADFLKHPPEDIPRQRFVIEVPK